MLAVDKTCIIYSKALG